MKIMHYAIVKRFNNMLNGELVNIKVFPSILRRVYWNVLVQYTHLQFGLQVTYNPLKVLLKFMAFKMFRFVGTHVFKIF